ncbi:hypothetical protein G6F59_016685 [Rhizopus arrhizus]|nr:hypothetical protein G6F59_016685 [Rhizopus arrhizus]
MFAAVVLPEPDVDFQYGPAGNMSSRYAGGLGLAVSMCRTQALRSCAVTTSSQTPASAGVLTGVNRSGCARGADSICWHTIPPEIHQSTSSHTASSPTCTMQNPSP